MVVKEGPDGKKSQMFTDLGLSTKLLSMFKSVKEKEEVVHMFLGNFRKKTLHRNHLQSILKYLILLRFNMARSVNNIY